jgi:glyoxylase-like metal-dependent hydrolase (beta-lactamase superfamily II)
MKRAGAAWLALLCASGVSFAADPVLDKAARRLGIADIQSLEYEAHGRYWQFTQAPAPGAPWPPFDVDGYVATLDYARSAVHAKYHRVQVQEPGRARPHAEATQDQYALDGMSWNLTPAPLAMPANVAERNAELWASPQGFIKAALANDAKISVDKEGRAVEFRIGKSRYLGSITLGGDVRYVATWMDSPVLGDVRIEFSYADYRDFASGTGTVRFPARITRKVGGFPWYALNVTAVRVNNAVAFTVPEEIRANPVPSVSNVEVTALAPGVWNFGGVSHNTVVVEQARGLVVIEAPLSEERSLAILAQIEQRFGKRRILGVVNTHAHFDHAGGLRTFVAARVPVITHQANAAYYATVWKQPRKLNPDRMSRSRRHAAFHPFTDRLVLEDATRPVEIHAIQGSGHNDAFAMVWLPVEKILVEADAYTPTPAGAKPPAVVNPLWMNLDANIRRLNLDVQRIQPLHGTAKTIEEFRAALIAPAN